MYNYIREKLYKDLENITDKKILLTNELLKTALEDMGRHFVYNAFIFGKDVSFDQFYNTLFSYLKMYLKID